MGALYRSTLENLSASQDIAGEGPLLLNLLLDRMTQDISPEEGSKWLRDALSVSLDKEMDAVAKKALGQMKVRYENELITAEDYEKGLVDSPRTWKAGYLLEIPLKWDSSFCRLSRLSDWRKK